MISTPMETQKEARLSARHCYKEISKKDTLNQKLMPILDDFCILPTLKSQKNYFADHTMFELDQIISYLSSDLKHWLNIIEQTQYFLLTAQNCCKKRQQSLYPTHKPQPKPKPHPTDPNPNPIPHTHELPSNDDLDLFYNESMLQHTGNPSNGFAQKKNLYAKD
jgi:hypothetical protein